MEVSELQRRSTSPIITQFTSNAQQKVGGKNGRKHLFGQCRREVTRYFVPDTDQWFQTLRGSDKWRSSVANSRQARATCMKVGEN